MYMYSSIKRMKRIGRNGNGKEGMEMERKKDTKVL